MSHEPETTAREARENQVYSVKTDPCVAIGAHVGHNPQATEAVRADVMAFLTATLLK